MNAKKSQTKQTLELHQQNTRKMIEENKYVEKKEISNLFCFVPIFLLQIA